MQHGERPMLTHLLVTAARIWTLTYQMVVGDKVFIENNSQEKKRMFIQMNNGRTSKHWIQWQLIYVLRHKYRNRLCVEIIRVRFSIHSAFTSDSKSLQDHQTSLLIFIFACLFSVLSRHIAHNILTIFIWVYNEKHDLYVLLIYVFFHDHVLFCHCRRLQNNPLTSIPTELFNSLGSLIDLWVKRHYQKKKIF